MRPPHAVLAIVMGAIFVGGVLLIADRPSSPAHESPPQAEPVQTAPSPSAAPPEVVAAQSTEATDEPPKVDPSVLQGLDLQATAADSPHISAAGAAREARLQQPDAVYMGVAESRWFAISRELQHIQTAQANDFAQSLQPLIRDWLAARSSPDKADMDSLLARQADTLARLEASGLINEPIREILTSLQQAGAKAGF